MMLHLMHNLLIYGPPHLSIYNFHVMFLKIKSVLRPHVNCYNNYASLIWESTCPSELC